MSRPTHDELLAEISNATRQTVAEAVQTILDGEDAWCIEDSMPTSPVPRGPSGGARGTGEVPDGS